MTIVHNSTDEHNEKQTYLDNLIILLNQLFCVFTPSLECYRRENYSLNVLNYYLHYLYIIIIIYII